MTPPFAVQWLDDELRLLEARDRLRAPAVADPLSGARVAFERRALVNFCGNDYLGLRLDPMLAEASIAAARTLGTGSGASRLVTGNLSQHESAERALASLVKMDSALLTSSGYAANVGALSALAGDGDVVFSDALNHASLIDGARLSRARTVVYRHADAEDLAARIAQNRPFRRGFVVTESLFSMDGDIAPLVALRELCAREGAHLYVDEAHALGVYGPSGAGLCAAHGVTPDVLVGTLGKSLGGQGAFVAGSVALRHFLWNRSRSFVFSTGVAPSLAAVAVAACVRVGDETLRAALFARITQLRSALAATEIPCGGAPSGPIVPLAVGDERRALALSEALAERGFLVKAIRPPTVPVGGSRLRVTLSAAHTASEVEALVRALTEVW